MKLELSTNNLFVYFQYIAIIYIIYQFESDILNHLARLFSIFLRNNKQNPFDTAIIIIEKYSDQNIQNKIAKFFDFNSEPFALIE